MLTFPGCVSLTVSTLEAHWDIFLGHTGADIHAGRHLTSVVPVFRSFLGLTPRDGNGRSRRTSPVSTDAEAAFNCLHPALALFGRPVFRAVSNQKKRTRSRGPGSPRLGEFPVDTSEGSTPVVDSH